MCVCTCKGSEHRAIGIRQLAGGELRWGRDEFFAGRNDRDARAAEDRDGIYAGRGEGGDDGGIDKRAGRGYWRAGLDVLAGGTDMRLGGGLRDGDLVRKCYRAGRGGGVLHGNDEHSCGIGHGGTGHDAHGVAGGHIDGSRAGRYIAGDGEGPWCGGGKIRGMDEEAIHRRIGMGRHGEARGGVGSEDAADEGGIDWRGLGRWSGSQREYGVEVRGDAAGRGHKTQVSRRWRTSDGLVGGSPRHQCHDRAFWSTFPRPKPP